jgi:hypothetical protein
VKKVKNFVSKFVLLALALTSLGPVYSVAQEQKVPTKKEFITLLTTAKEPPEHRRIAAYYQQEAAALRESAKEHAELAAIYQEKPPFAALESKHGDAFGQGASHCKKFARLAEEQAKEADALATLHEEMAVAAEQKQ